MDFRKFLLERQYRQFQGATGYDVIQRGELRDLRAMYGATGEFFDDNIPPQWSRAVSGLIGGMGNVFRQSMYGNSGVGMPITPSGVIPNSLHNHIEPLKITVPLLPGDDHGDATAATLIDSMHHSPQIKKMQLMGLINLNKYNYTKKVIEDLHGNRLLSMRINFGEK